VLAGNDVITVRTEVTSDSERVCTVYATLVSRGAGR
jgi:hypothetical protein